MTEKPLYPQNDDREWPFPDVPPELRWALPEADRAGIEQVIQDMIEGRNSKH